MIEEEKMVFEKTARAFGVKKLPESWVYDREFKMVASPDTIDIWHLTRKMNKSYEEWCKKNNDS